MIPAFVDENTPPGEREVYNLIASGPEDWTVIHSLDLAPWNRSLRTEIDFLALIPESGIVCIEVKSHDEIFFEDGRWYPLSIKRSPFKQAADGRFAFHRRLRLLAPHLNRIPVVHLCIFPKASFDLKPNMSVQPWELIDGRCFHSFKSGLDFCGDINARVVRSIAEEAGLAPLADPISGASVSTIVDICLPVRKRRPDKREEIRRREEEAERLLGDQQRPVLQLSALNDRLIVSGGAGTGKTLIAMEVARRAAERGMRVGLLCFNRMIGDWMKAQMEQHVARLPSLVVGRAVRMMLDLTGLTVPEHPMDSYWEAELPERLEECLTDPEFQAIATFDFLVLDEAQDILSRPRLWQCLAQFLNGGIEGGRFALFGDFENQVMSSHDIMARTLEDLGERARPSRWHLSQNCRNYRIIGDTAVRLSGFGTDVYSGYLRAGGCIDSYNIHYYESREEQLEILAQCLRDYRDQGYRPSEVSILSLCAEEKCVASALGRTGFKLQPAWRKGDHIGYSTIQAFKGMENKAVILTDLEVAQKEFHRHIFYTGMTRATESLRLLCSRESMNILLGWLSGKEIK